MRAKGMCKPGLIGFLILVLAAPPGAFGQTSGTAGTFRQEELEQLLAPIALYPDSLLAQILVASTYPLEVVEADRWVQRNKDLKGDQLNDALDKTSWDLSVKALVPFPDILATMSEKLDWTQKLGDAFLAQESEVMSTIQKLRGKARAEGNLQDTEQQKVIVQGDAIEIQPANPTVIYVPSYNPTVVYGSWGYPSYPPYYFNPVGATIATGVLGFAAGVAVGSAWNSGWGHWNWGGGNYNANINRNVNINRNNINVRISRRLGGSTIRVIAKGLPIATRPAGTATVRGVRALRMPDVIFAAFLRTGRAGAREISDGRAGDNLPTNALPRDPAEGSLRTDVHLRDQGRGRGDDPTPHQPCKASSLISPGPEPGAGNRPGGGDCFPERIPCRESRS